VSPEEQGGRGSSDGSAELTVQTERVTPGAQRPQLDSARVGVQGRVHGLESWWQRKLCGVSLGGWWLGMPWTCVSD
jgi:hypothetical protein